MVAAEGPFGKARREVMKKVLRVPSKRMALMVVLVVVVVVVVSGGRMSARARRVGDGCAIVSESVTVDLLSCLVVSTLLANGE